MMTVDYEKLIPWTRVVAWNKIDQENGEFSIFEDAIQEGILYSIERAPRNNAEARNNILRGIEYFLRKHRERYHKRKFWQTSTNNEVASLLWGNDDDFLVEA